MARFSMYCIVSLGAFYTATRVSSWAMKADLFVAGCGFAALAYMEWAGSPEDKL